MVITVGRQYGSGGREIGTALANKLGIVYYDDLLKQFLQHEVGVSAQESHFSNALVLQRISLFIHQVE